MNKETTNNKVIAFHPGNYVEEYIDDLGITQAEFAKRLDTTEKTLSKLINGLVPVSREMALKLALVTGISVGTWLNLQAEYERRKMEQVQVEQLEKEQRYLAFFDYDYFKKWSGAAEESGKLEKTRELLRCLKISSFEVLERPDFLACFKTAESTARNKKIICSNAWVQIAINTAQTMPTEPFNEEALRGHLDEIRAMSLQAPREFSKRLHEIFASCGVAFVILEHLKNSGVNAATKWLDSQKVMIAINARGRDADKFWFALFHEIKHVFQKQVKRIMISGTVMPEELNEALEFECDQFARDILIPKEAYKKYINNYDITERSIRQFSSSIGVDPGIVVGRLQHDGHVPYTQYHGLKQKYFVSAD